jgi:hypothetical protein
MRKNEPSETDDEMTAAREVMRRRRKAMWALAQGIIDEDREILRKLSKG